MTVASTRARESGGCVEISRHPPSDGRKQPREINQVIVLGAIALRRPRGVIPILLAAARIAAVA